MTTAIAPNFVFLYVANPQASAQFYAQLLGRQPVEISPTFAMFALPNRLMLGLWVRDGVQPPPSAQPGAVELGVPVADEAAVRALYAEWQALGLTLLQAPTSMDFGWTFTAADPDGHRLRVFASHAM